MDCKGVVLDPLLASKGMPGFAFSYAGTILVRTLFERELVGRPGLDHTVGSGQWLWPRGSQAWQRQAGEGGWTAYSHPLVTVGRRARRARATRDHRIKGPRPATSKSLIFSKLQRA